MGDVGSTIGRATAGVFSLGVSELIRGMVSRPTAAPPTPGVTSKGTKVDETQVEEQEKTAERRRRQLIASQNRNIKTSPLGASIDQGMLGGPTLTGQ